ncbi:MAG: WD40/YVTN/BNR-like repeat-containing protein [Deltaproteobacteria bacterium]
MFRPPAVAALAAALVAVPARAADWRWLSPTPTGNSVNGASFPTASAGYLVGAAGTLLASTNGGASWTTEAVPTGADLFGVFFLPDGVTGWAVGDLGTILHTTDGLHWAIQPSPTSQKLYAVTFIDSLHGFAAGDQRTLVQTADGGKSWTLRDGQILSINALTFTDALHGFAAGWGGVVLLTIDGGQSFSQVETPTTADLLALSFVDSTHGWAVGVGGAIVKTSDGGQSWQIQSSSLTNQDLVGLVAISDTVAYAVGSGGSFYYTNDGQSWRVGNWLYPGSPLTGLAPVPGGGLVALGGDGHVYAAQATATPGQQLFFDENQGLSSFETVTGLAFGDALHGVVVAGGVLYYTQNGGVSLLPGSIPPSSQPSRPFVAWQAVSMPTTTTAFAVGTGGGVAVSHDAGQSWSWLSDQASFTVVDLSAVYFIDGQVGYAAGAQGSILATRNGGQTWAGETTPAFGTLRALWFATPDVGAAVGDNGAIVLTRNGMAWAAANVPPGLPTLRGISGLAAGKIYAVGDRGTSLVSLDQGQTWYPEPAFANADLGAIAMLDRLNGFLIASHPGQILVTRDGAQSWQRQQGGVPSLSALAFTDLLHGFVGGTSGALLGTVTGGEASCAQSADCADAGASSGLGYACVQGACSPCNLETSCTQSCTPCAAPVPFCLGTFCGQCLADKDCDDGGTCIAGGCVLNEPLPDGGPRPNPDAGFQGFDGGIIVVLPDGGVRLNPGALCCGCRPDAGREAPVVPLALAAVALVSFFLHRRRARR